MPGLCLRQRQLDVYLIGVQVHVAAHVKQQSAIGWGFVALGSSVFSYDETFVIILAYEARAPPKLLLSVSASIPPLYLQLTDHQPIHPSVEYPP